MGVPPSDTLGFRLYADANGGGGSIGSELCGTVSPRDFVPTEFHVQLNMARKIVQNAVYTGILGQEQAELGQYLGLDQSLPEFMDIDPQSGSSAGQVYDLDAPRVSWLGFSIPRNFVWRRRTNFQEWAECSEVRCSALHPWFTRQSYRLSSSQEEGQASSATALTVSDNTKTWTANAWTDCLIRVDEALVERSYARRITSNTGDTVFVTPSWGLMVTPSFTRYVIAQYGGWVKDNAYAGDNISDDGTTQTSLDLQ